MLKKNKLTVILSSVIILLPMLFGLIVWEKLPDIITTHFGADGAADGFSGKSFVVFGFPLIFLALHVLVLIVTALDKGQKEQTKKALRIIFWIMPALSLFVSTVMYSVALGKDFHLTMLIPAFMGVLFILMGNYLPKVKRNSTLGIKLSWALRNEENWNRTHRFGGKVMVVCGLVMLLAAFLPMEAVSAAFVCVIAAIAIAPAVYSYRLYRQHQREGIEYPERTKNQGEKIFLGIGAVVVSILLIGIAIVMFTGDIAVTCGDRSLAIDATYWTDIEVTYSEIDAVEYREELDLGMRTGGFASARLSMGIFRNDAFGSYTLYSYTGAESYVVLTADERTLVIGLCDATETKAIYNTLMEKIGGQ